MASWVNGSLECLNQIQMAVLEDGCIDSHLAEAGGPWIKPGALYGGSDTLAELTHGSLPPG